MKVLFLILLLSPAVSKLQADLIQLAGRTLDDSYYGVTSHQGRNQEMFDYFTLSSASTLDTVSWYGLFSSGDTAMPLDTASFRVFLFSNNPARDPLTFGNYENLSTELVPDATAFYSTTATSNGVGVGAPDPLHGGEIMKWSLSLSGLYLDPGTYWLSISATADDPGYFLWHRAQSPVDSAYLGEVFADGTNRVDLTSEHCAMAWDVSGTQSVPDDTSPLGLFGLGVIGMLAISQRKRLRSRWGQIVQCRVTKSEFA